MAGPPYTESLSKLMYKYTCVDVRGGAGGWAQSGTMYRWGYGSCVKRWAQQSATGSNWNDYYLSGCSTVGESHRYWQELVFSNGAWRVRSRMDASLIH